MRLIKCFYSFNPDNILFSAIFISVFAEAIKIFNNNIKNNFNYFGHNNMHRNKLIIPYINNIYFFFNNNVFNTVFNLLLCLIILA